LIGKEELMMKLFYNLGALFVVLVIVCVRGDVLSPPQNNPDCPRPWIWSGYGGWDWSNPGNWENYEDQPVSSAPKIFSQVYLEQGNYTNLDTNVSVSSVYVGPHHKLKITGKLTVNNVELHCWGVNWCNNHGSCVDINTCQCYAGWSGLDCSQKECDNGVQLSSCGICENEPGGDQDICHCTTFLGENEQDVDRVMLIDTNKALLADIETLLSLIAQVQAANSQYDPNSLILQNQIINYILYLQNFAATNLTPFLQSNQNFLTLLTSLNTRSLLPL